MAESIVAINSISITESGVLFTGLGLLDWTSIHVNVAGLAKHENIPLLWNLFWKKTVLPKIVSCTIVDNDKNIKKNVIIGNKIYIDLTNVIYDMKNKMMIIDFYYKSK